MSSKTPIFPISDPLQLQHDQTDSFHQVLGYEIRKQHRRIRTRPVNTPPPVKLSKPILREEFKKSKKRQWWQNALRFIKWSTTHDQKDPSGFRVNRRSVEPNNNVPVYGGEFWTAVVPCRSSGPRSGPIAGTELPKKSGRIEIPYLNLRQLNDDRESRISNSSLPIYLVT